MREFPVALILLLGTGIVVERASSIEATHRAFDYLLGTPIMSHHLAVKRLWDAVKAHVRSQHPDVFQDLPAITKDNAAEILEATRVTFGETLPLSPISEGQVELPWFLEGIPEGMPVITVGIDEDGICSVEETRA